MTDTYDEEARSAMVSLDARRMLMIALAGAGAGVIVWGLTAVLGNYVLGGILCHSQTMQCASADQYAEILASIVAAGAGLFALVRMQVFRPLLVVLGALLSLWGVVALASTLPWYGTLLSCLFMYAAAYLAFAWLARLRSFGLVLVLFVVLIVMIRYAFSL